MPDIPPRNEEVEPGSFDLVAPISGSFGQRSLEKRSEQLFSRAHLVVIFSDLVLLVRFTSFIRTSRLSSVPLLVYYFDAFKTSKAIIDYSNYLLGCLGTLDGHTFTESTAAPTANEMLQARVDIAFEALIRIASVSIRKRITGTLSAHLRQMSEGLAEVLCLTDPSREDNPVVFASEGKTHAMGRNSGKEHFETQLNYRRDGSPFMNLLMCAPLLESRGLIRYMIGAQVDVSGLANDCAGIESPQRLVDRERTGCFEAVGDHEFPANGGAAPKDVFRELSEMFNAEEIGDSTKWGNMQQLQNKGIKHGEATSNWRKPRVVIQDGGPAGSENGSIPELPGGQLAGIYENYLLVRPYPNLRILFASPSLRVPGILQSPFHSKIGGDGTVVTARVRWIRKHNHDGKARWIHCTPLVGIDEAVGVWMVVIVDDDEESRQRSLGRVAPPTLERVESSRLV
ncbi:hypothetical protein B0H67DRAFT_599581 [Lasiosphaeris hirsuta]|uniref:PAS domain-containing protein n=1 Tax=Lasiosphaeris hirsuta TaxID=260670 RepID=A0AA40AQ97_9PEZI|nr:hypothetical protein B0H67DRAFT_599581 [Lasiosphaeris hirsuta]